MPDDASFFFVNDYGPQLTIAYLNLAIMDPKEAMTYPACGSVPHLTVAYPHMTVLQITTLNLIIVAVMIRNVGGQKINTKCRTIPPPEKYSFVGRNL